MVEKCLFSSNIQYYKNGSFCVCVCVCVCVHLYLLKSRHVDLNLGIHLSMLLSIRDVGPETKELKVRLVEKNSKGERESLFIQ